MDELEALLRQYRPAGPGPALRRRIVRPRPDWRQWIYPIAAAAAAMTFYALSDATHRRVLSTTSPAAAEREAALGEMAVDLGGGDGARLEAERLMTGSEASRLDQHVQGIVGLEESAP